jgi:hypothetical protein
MPDKVFGLDLRDHSISAVVVTHGKRGTRLEAHARVPVVPPDGTGDGLLHALEELTGSVDPSGCTCAVSIPPGLAAYRNLQIPFSNPKKIRQILPFELEPTLPYAADAVTIGFQSLEEPDENHPAHTGLIAAAVEKDRLQPILDALSAVKIRPETVTVGGYSAARWVAHRQIDSDALVVDLDGLRCAVFALSEGEVAMVRAFSLGRPATAGTGAMLTQILQTVRAMQDLMPETFLPQSAFITRIESRLPDLEQGLSETLKLPVDRIDPGRDVPGAGTGEDTAPTDNALALALVEAAGLEGINFRPGPTGLKRLWGENRSSLVRTTILAAAVLVLALVSVLADTVAKQNRLDDLNRRIRAVFTDTFPDVRTVVDPLQQMRVSVREARREAGLSQGGGRMRVIDILREMSLRIPADVDVDFGQTVIGEDGVRVSGSTGGFDSVDRVKNSLTGMPGFSTVNISSATVDKSGGRVRFKLKMVP